MSAGLPNFSVGDYSKFFLAGALCCTVTHGAMTPVDVVKTRIQIDPSLKGLGMISAARQVVASGGPSVLLTGFGPTAVGYLVQGGAKFAGYEFWKKRMVEAAGGTDKAIPNRTSIYLLSSTIAELFADVLLAPLEAVRIRLVSDKAYASGLAPGFARMAREGGLREFYAGFIPLAFKQVPYAIGQFTVNEWMHELVKKSLSADTQKNLGATGQFGVNLGCGLTAGAAAAILSQPADTLLSQINKGKGGPGGVLSKLANLAKEAGPAGLFSGLGPRIVMTGFLVAGQFLLYGAIKDAVQAPKGVEIQKKTAA